MSIKEDMHKDYLKFREKLREHGYTSMKELLDKYLAKYGEDE